MRIKVPDKVKRRMKRELEKYSDVLRMAIKKNINESDTSNIVNDMLGDIFGYDKFFDITTEYKIRKHYVDYGVKINDQVKMLIEVKAVGVPLSEQHIFQAVSYAANEGIEWVALTNAHTWQLYHVKFTRPIDKTLVYSVNVLDKTMSESDIIKLLYLISKESLVDNVLDRYWAEESLSSPEIIAGVLFTSEIIDRIRQELKQLTGYLMTPRELKTKLKAEIIREDLVPEISPAKAAETAERPAQAKKRKAA